MTANESESTSLECGSSLAEREHCVGERGGLPPSKDHPIHGEALNSIQSLRSALAADTLTSGGTIETFTSPFEVPSSCSQPGGDRYLTVPLVYCDQTASNRPVRSIERYMENTCLPLYGNTHTNTSITGSQSTAFVAEARQIVAESTNAKITGKASLDVVLFAGNGSTSAVELLIDCLGLKHAAERKANRPVVFVGPFEHHSNLLPWRESGCEIVMIPEWTATGTVDIVALGRILSRPEYTNRLKMGTFTAASNVTGKVCNVDEIAATLHKHGALAFFDYATGAPYMTINMNPPPSPDYPSASLVAKDAIFLSPHKMLGGVGTPGVLILKKHLVNQVNAPSRSGGGTVFYVTSTHHRFLSSRIERYEGGTPNIAGIMRTGLTFLLKRQAEQQFSLLKDTMKESAPNSLLDLDYETYNQVVTRLHETAPNIVLLGDRSGGQHLPIFSFLVRCGRRFLHFNYVCALLNDVFGIQSRGGCQCSGPYSQRLLGLTEMTADGQDVPNKQNEQLEHALVHYKERAELLRPGYTRLSLPFKGVRLEEVEYVLKALEWVAKHGWALMCQYRCNHRTGEWRHFSRQGKPLGRSERKWLSHYNMLSQQSHDKPFTETAHGSVSLVLEQALANADDLLTDAKLDQRNLSQAIKMNDAGVTLGTDGDFLESLRWYVYPKECAIWLSEGRVEAPETESDKILGAIRPIQHGPVNPQLEASTDDHVGSNSIMNDATQNLMESDNNLPIKEKETFLVEIPSLILFRDGEHMGEAILEDINAGFDDGELSERCEVFDELSDEWLPIAEFLKGSKRQRSDIQTTDECASNGTSCGSLKSMIPTNRHQTTPMKSVTEHEFNGKHDSATKDAANQHKKPQRDSVTWGQSTFPPVETSSLQSFAVVGGDALKDNDASSATPTPSLFVDQIVPKKRKKGLGEQPPPKLMRYITQAIMQWKMIEEGDRLLLGLSGGKDSLSLLHCLLEYQRKARVNFDIEVCTIDPMTPSFDPSPLIPYVESLGLKYHYIRDDIVARASTSGKDGKVVSSLCAFCARMKRGNLYTCARRNNCNKLVLAQHLDDCAESFLMSVMHNGFLRTMKANYRVNAGDISVIRPMVYCREGLMTEFAKATNLPVINENCPACFEEPKERARVKKLLSREETLYPNIHDNIRRSLIPLMHDDATAILRCYTEEAISRSRKKGKRGAESIVDGTKHADEADATPRITGKSNENGASTTFETVSDQKKRSNNLLLGASDEDLVMELARRKAEKFRLSGAMKRLENDDDPTGQVCTLNGTNGSIPCRELME